jgi:UDP-glucose:(heptosyl)LPS alpha-1,3-glucosyltransferase
MAAKPRIAVVSPFLDKRHGTERCVVEQIERLAHQHGYEVHLYCQRAEDIEGLEEFGKGGHAADGQQGWPGRILWHKVSDIAGPHLVKYIWWFLANQFRRRRDQKRLGRYDLVYSPGINCRDADAIIIHIVFHEFHRLVRDDLRLRSAPLRAWPRAIHRKLYYRLIMALEKRIYPNPRVALAAVSHLTAREVRRFFGRNDVRVIPNAVDVDAFSPAVRQKRRAQVRRHMRFGERDFVLLLVGNDWKKKGLMCLFEAVARCLELPLKVLVVGRDARAPYEAAIARMGLGGRVRFAEPSADVVQFYAAADAYVGPSLHDSFALPPAEAMSCGLPVITSASNGGSEMITDGVDGLILRDAKDAAELAEMIRQLFTHADLRWRLGENAARTAQQYRWERNARQTQALLEEVLARKNK